MFFHSNIRKTRAGQSVAGQLQEVCNSGVFFEGRRLESLPGVFALNKVVILRCARPFDVVWLAGAFFFVSLLLETPQLCLYWTRVKWKAKGGNLLFATNISRGIKIQAWGCAVRRSASTLKVWFIHDHSVNTLRYALLCRVTQDAWFELICHCETAEGCRGNLPN